MAIKPWGSLLSGTAGREEDLLTGDSPGELTLNQHVVC